MDRTTAPFILADQAANVIAERSGIKSHDIALVLGSGWGNAAELIGETVSEISATDVPGFHATTVAGHVPTLRSIRIRQQNSQEDHYALVLGARSHYYQGHGVRAVAHGIRTAAACGATTVVMTNGCGSIIPHWQPGQVVIIRDHINLTGTTPLEGATFIDMTNVYTQRLKDIVHGIDPELPEGVYVQFSGPQYETPAEVQMARILGGDLVGMSTALEAIAARQLGMDILGLSLVTNLAAGISSSPLSHQEVIDTGSAASERIAHLLANVIRAIYTPQNS